MRDFPQINLLGQLAPHRRRHVLVVAQLPAGQRPRTALRVARALPEQDVELRLLGLRPRPEAANLEYDGEHFVSSATMWHVFDYKSKTRSGAKGSAMTVLNRVDPVAEDLAAAITSSPTGYAGVEGDERWAAEIRRLAELRNATILAHNYQLPAIQDVADHVGDSLALSRIAAEAPEETIVFCGVHFMAETAKILSPEKTVLIPDQRAGCSLADSITAEELQAWKDEHRGAVVVSYVNTTAAVKALTDVCCTSSNAVDVVASIDADREVLFCPDQFLGAHVRRETGRRNLHVWAGECHVHAGINGDELSDQARKHPDAELFVHPECGCATSALYLAGEGALPEERVKILSTGGMLDAARATEARQVLVATEVGMLYQLRNAAPGVDFQAVNDRASCKYMKMITPAALLRCLIEGADEVHVDAQTAVLARRSVQRMIAIGQPGGDE
jgi:quinolinate synthase